MMILVRRKDAEEKKESSGLRLNRFNLVKVHRPVD